MYCGRTYKLYHGLRNHLLDHNGAGEIPPGDASDPHLRKPDAESIKQRRKRLGCTRDFSCTQCDKLFELRAGLVGHMSREHSDRERYECMYCEYTCHSKSAWYNHLREHVSRGQVPDEDMSSKYSKVKQRKVKAKEISKMEHEKGLESFL